MTATVTLELPESILIQALRQLRPARRQELLRRIEDEDLRMKPGTGINRQSGARNVSAREGAHAPRSPLSQALGLLATERAAPTDLEIKQMLAERR